MGCTAEELRAWLPGASGDRGIAWRSDGADIGLDAGTVSIAWEALEPRRIALVTLPRLRVRFAATGVDAAAWQRFMRHFDLYTLRGGG
ncbi:MAG TPA: hypothetical protein VM845_11720 [Burkholderiaceae bacterium]|nr:hypothetical protein [Burkholderiaceae bacterium]